VLTDALEKESYACKYGKHNHPIKTSMAVGEGFAPPILIDSKQVIDNFRCSKQTKRRKTWFTHKYSTHEISVIGVSILLNSSRTLNTPFWTDWVRRHGHMPFQVLESLATV
jgi:hypothetical protein